MSMNDTLATDLSPANCASTPSKLPAEEKIAKLIHSCLWFSTKEGRAATCAMLGTVARRYDAFSASPKGVNSITPASTAPRRNLSLRLGIRASSRGIADRIAREAVRPCSQSQLQSATAPFGES